jgi:hypothetical protein
MANNNQGGKFSSLEEENNDMDKKINISSHDPAGKNPHSGSKKMPHFMDNMVKHKEDVAAGVLVRGNSNYVEEMSKNTMSRVNGYLGFIGNYFNVEVDDIKQKLISSVIPFKPGFHELAEKNPDLYGPFWIYTTLIFIVSFAGNISNYIHVCLYNYITKKNRHQIRKLSFIILISYLMQLYV